jgi:hypothetical protein
MQANMGKADRIIRYIVVLVIIVLFVTRRIHGALAVVLGIIGIVLLLTAFVNFCPLYRILGISTAKKEK